MSKLEDEINQDLTQALHELSRLGEERRRRERRRELVALGRKVLERKLRDIELLHEAHAPLSDQDNVDERLILQILHRKPRRRARR